MEPVARVARMLSLFVILASQSCIATRVVSRGGKHVLLVGNTGLLGENLEQAICDEGHKITVLARRQVPVLSCSTLVVAKDRTNSTELHAALENHGSFDSIVDVSAFNPQSVSVLVSTLTALSKASGKSFDAFYFLISSISGCVGFVPPGDLLHEDYCDHGPIARQLDGIQKHNPTELESKDRRGATYGVRKLATERALLSSMPPNKAIIVQPSYIIGAGDDRAKLFPYWIMRMSTGEPVLVPRETGDTIQFTDALSTAQWMASAVKHPKTLADISGVPRYFAVGPAYTVSQILDEIKMALNSEGVQNVRTVTWNHRMSDPDLQPRVFPLLQNSEGKVDPTRSTGAGLLSRPLKDIFREVYQQWASKEPPSDDEGWLSAEFWEQHTKPHARPLDFAMTRAEELMFISMCIAGDS